MQVFWIYLIIYTLNICFGISVNSQDDLRTVMVFIHGLPARIVHQENILFYDGIYFEHVNKLNLRNPGSKKLLQFPPIYN